MKRTVWIWELFGFAVTSILGTLLHFLYEFSGKSFWIAPFSGVNESAWEHMKLIFWPMLIYAVFQSFFFGKYGSFWCVKLRGILIGLGLIPLIYYTYNGAIAKSPDYINIAIFFIAAAVAYIYETRAFKKRNVTCKSPKIAVTILVLISVSFIIFSFKTPEIGIFKDPVTGAYGIW